MAESQLRPNDWRRRTRVVRVRLPLCIAATVLAVTMSSCLTGRSRGSSKPTAFNGRVLRVQGKDTVAVANAKVWTAPFSADTRTDSTGYFEIKTGLVPGDYSVYAEEQGVKGEVKSAAAVLNKYTEVFVLLGVEETAWPPSSAFNKFRPKLPPPGVGDVRPDL